MQILLDGAMHNVHTQVGAMLYFTGPNGEDYAFDWSNHILYVFDEYGDYHKCDRIVEVA